MGHHFNDVSIMPFDLKTFTLVHVAISLVAIASGFVVLFGLIAGKRLEGWTAFCVATTIATSVTGFGIPDQGRDAGYRPRRGSPLSCWRSPCIARYGRHPAGAWRPAYIITAVMALYLNVFVLIVQSFEEVPALKAMAPTQSEPPFAIVQARLR